MIKKNKKILDWNKIGKKPSNFIGYSTIWKEIGETPLEVIESLKDDKRYLENEKIAYAGRLDPMAEGKLLVLVGDTCKERNKYLSLDKEYEFEILLGFKSDTKDLLGLPKKNDWKTTWFSNKQFNYSLSKYIGKITLPYPVFSSKTVDNKPLFLWALEKRLDEIQIPTKESEIFSLKFISKRRVSGRFLLEDILKKINKPTKVVDESKKLGKDFRREEIRQKWIKLLENEKDDNFLIVKLRTVVSSGTYMRTLSEKIADELLEDYGLAYSIKRTKIGNFKKKFIFHFWKKLY